ncbi:hypothetical protein ABW20_dc0108580 [Dactylellina cionopaga]|nr:hypothetical protein ABW20_dc0108580 [Dactylellina cionopaga]
MLHSAFWVHGGESLQCSHSHDETESFRETVASKAKRITTALFIQIERCSKSLASQIESPTRQPIDQFSISAFGLDFLYPPRALALLQRLSLKTIWRSPNSRVAPYLPRSYSSFIRDSAKERREAIERDDRIRRDDEDEYEYAPSAMAEGLFDKRKRNMKGTWAPELEPRTLETMNPANFDLSDKSYDQAWNWYFRTANAPRAPMLFMSPESHRRRLLLGYLTQSRRRIDYERKITLLENIDPLERRLTDWRSLIDAYLFFDQVDLAFNALSKLVDEDIGTSSVGFERFFAYCISNNTWDRAINCWQLLQLDLVTSQTQKPGALKLIPRYASVQPRVVVTGVDDFATKFTKWVSNLIENDPLSRDFATWLAIGVERERAKGDDAKLSKAEFDMITEELVRKKLYLPDAVNLEYRILAKPYGAQHKEVLQDFSQYRLEGEYSPSPMVLYRILVATIALNDFQSMQTVFDDWFRFHRYPLAEAYRAILPVFAKRGEADIVEELWAQFSNRFVADADDYSHVLRAYIERGEVATAVEKLDSMHLLSLKPNINCFNALLRGFAKAEDMESAMEYLNIILDQGFEPDANTYASMMYVCAARGDFENVDLLFRAASKKMKPTLTMWNMVVWAHLNGGARSLAWKIIHFIHRQNMGFSLTHMYNMLMSAHANKKELENVNRIFQEMQSREIPFDFYSYTIMMRALTQTQHRANLQKARQMLDILQTQNIQTNAVPYFTLMQGYLRRRKYTEVFAIYTMMLENQVEPNFGVQSMLLLASIFEAQDLGRFSGNVDLTNAEEISRIAIDKFSGFDPLSFKAVKTAIPTEVFTPLISAYIYKEDYDSVRRTYQNFLEISSRKGANRNKPSMNMYLKLLHASQRERNWKGLREIWNLMFREAKRRSRPLTEISTGKNVVTVMKREMCPAFDIMIKAAIDTTEMIPGETDGIKVPEISDLMNQIVSWGFDLDGGNWNSLIVLIAINGDLEQSFRLAESQLVREEAQDYGIRKQRRFGFVGWAKHAQHPHLHTLDVLAGQLNSLINIARDYDVEAAEKARVLLKTLSEETPVIWQLTNIRRRRGPKAESEEFHKKLVDFGDIIQQSQRGGLKITHHFGVAPFSVRKERSLQGETYVHSGDKRQKVPASIGDLEIDWDELSLDG